MEAMKKVVAIVQARMGSTRFPSKVMQPILGVPMIEVLLERLGKAKLIDRIVLATSTGAQNDAMAEHVQGLGYRVYRGSENDVLDRYFQAALVSKADIVVRVTGDCPLIDPEVADSVVSALISANADYASNVSPPSFPDGLDAEAFTFAALKKAWDEARKPFEREHVTPYLREPGRFKTINVASADDFSAERWTVDEPADLEVIRNVFQHFQPSRSFGWKEVLKLRRTKPELFQANRHIASNEGAFMGTGEKLWKRAKRAIPGGNMLLSKRAEMFLPDRWPAYFSKAKGCKVWDLDGRELIDMSLMSVGSNTLGYGHPEVDEAVMDTVRAGNMSTLNCAEEVYLAEKLIELHPWAAMARLARSGGEANAISIRIARAASGRDKVAICGYHGWHDWYLAANLGDEKNLAGHLLPGLEPRGVPSALRESVLPFNYRRLDELEGLIAAHDIGVIKMEVSRSEEPDVEFLRKVRQLATSRGIVLIFDECTSGFRQSSSRRYLAL
jgi:glutamate-1-semialdehyde 2,1-aminomutase